MRPVPMPPVDIAFRAAYYSSSDALLATPQRGAGLVGEHGAHANDKALIEDDPQNRDVAARDVSVPGPHD
jgi:hypothetical protein